MQNSIVTQPSTLDLRRYPHQVKLNLRAWDAADEYLLSYLTEHKALIEQKQTIILNDAFGALVCGLANYKVSAISDSCISQIATRINLDDNNLGKNSATLLPSTNIASTDKTFDKIDTLITKIPKNLDFLMYMIEQLMPYMSKETSIILAGMVKNIPKTLWQTLEKNIGSTKTSLAKKKAKLIFLKPEFFNLKNHYPKTYIQEKTGFKIYNHANVFSKNSLDIGTRFLLNNLPQITNAEKIIDLGCGNGIIGLNLAKTYPQAQIIFTDESFMAIESAKITMQNNCEHWQKHRYQVNNCLDGFANNSTDAIICNPPFHQSHSIGTHIALQMFRQAQLTLKKGGIFIVIANRHLPYYSQLKRIFKNCKTLASNTKFNLYQMHKQ